MMPPKKSIFRQPGAQHFQLVHRSQRDPLIHDPDASQHVLKPFERENVKKGKSRADLESTLLPEDVLNNQKANIGEAALYGIYYDDTEYDYMQHLRPVGVKEDGVESILIEAPSCSKKSSKRTGDFEIHDLPDGVLASSSELPRTYESQQAIPESISGFQPDMDPHLRQTLEALEDDAFVDDNLGDDFFGELIADGERGSDKGVEFAFAEQGVEEDIGELNEDKSVPESWEERFAQFKRTQQMTGTVSDDGYSSEEADTIDGLPEMKVIGGKKRRRGTSEASGYSMSSSSMHRNEALQTLDERFDQIVIKNYRENEEEPTSHPSMNEDSDSDEAPELITSREDFEFMMNEFLHDYEILGRKMKPKLDGETGIDKLDTIRRVMGHDERVRIEARDAEEKETMFIPLEDDDKQDRWDCETILSTYSNLENHPRIIRAGDLKAVPKIKVDPKTGMPSVEEAKSNSTRSFQNVKSQVVLKPTFEVSDDTGSETDTPSRPQTISRPRNESSEERRARKAAVKAERQARRVDKKATKEMFSAEMKHQMRSVVGKEQKIKKL